jgi:hypothetical protein
MSYMSANNIAGIFDDVLTFLRDNPKVPREIREEIEGASEVVLQVGKGFFFIQYITADGIPKKYHHYANGMLMMTSGVNN